MTLLRSSLLALPFFTLVSCGTGGRVDAVNPTVAEMDRLDVQWGLPQRKSRGAPRRTYQYTAPSPSYGGAPTPSYSMPAEAPPPTAPPRETIQGLPPGSPQ
jgi:hypothetical protein